MSWPPEGSAGRPGSWPGTNWSSRAALVFIDQMLPGVDTDVLRDELQERRVKIQTYQALSLVEKAIAAFRAAHGHLPARLDQLVPGQLPGLPADPSGGQLIYDPATGDVRSTVLGPRAPLRVTR